MPANLPPEYFEADARYRAAKTPEEKIARLEEVLSTIPKHKGTERLRGDLRRRLSRLRVEAAGTRKSSSKHVSAFRIDRQGAGQVAVIGVTNVGKSALVAALTNAAPEVSDVPYTTWLPTPGMMTVGNVQIQLIDTPSLDRDFVEPELLNLIRRADLVLVVVDLQANPIRQLEDTVGFLQGQRILPRHRMAHYPESQRLTFIPLIVVVNKVDDERWDEDWRVLDELLGQEWTLVPASALTGRHLDRLRQAVFDHLGIVRVYAKPPGREADFSAPFVLRQGSTVADFASKVHKDFLDRLKMARVWGSGVYDGQLVGRDHVLHDGDVVELRI